MPALVKGRRDWPAVLLLGFSIDRNGKRRKPVWRNAGEPPLLGPPRV
jgi:hypothetical protein